MAADLIPPPTVFEQLAQSAMDVMHNVFETGLGLIGGLFDGMFGLKEGTLKGIFETFSAEGGPLTVLRDEITKIWDNLFGEKGGLKMTLDTLSGLVSGVFATMRTSVVNILKGLLSPLVTLLKAVTLIFAAIGDTDHAKAAADAALAIEGMKADGGPVRAGKNYIVGEKGPEIFKAPSSGSIITNKDAFGGGGGGSLNIAAVYISGTDNPAVFFDKLQIEAKRRNMTLGTAM